LKEEIKETTIGKMLKEKKLEDNTTKSFGIGFETFKKFSL